MDVNKYAVVQTKAQLTSDFVHFLHSWPANGVPFVFKSIASLDG